MRYDAVRMRRRTAVTAIISAAVAGLVLIWNTIGQDRAFRALIAEGDAALAVSDTSRAAAAFSGALAIQPESMLAHLKRGDTYRRRGELAASLADLTAANALRFVAKEAAVGGLNGLLFALMMGAAVIAWYGDWRLGAVIAAAMICNLVAAALAGTLIPLGLQKFGVDPAVSSTVFLTTVTDVIGFLAFLGLATLFLL